jgi:large subunit ribosomal protein L10
MTREEKNNAIESLSERIDKANVFYLADVADIDAEKTSKLRRLCHKNNVKLEVVKNTLLMKAFERADRNYEQLYDQLKGNTSIIFAEVSNAPAKIIKDFRKANDRPILKGAFIEESFYIGDNMIDTLATLKSKEELIGDIVLLLQSPAKNVISALQSGKDKLAGIVKTLSEKSA